MKVILKINLYIYALILCNISCSYISSEHKLLEKAESLIYINPKQTLNLLDSIHDTYNMTKEDQALYALLTTKAADKCYLNHNNDSLIYIAVNYYKDKRNRNKKAESYFYLGRVYQDNNDILGAIKAYLEAINAVPNDGKLKVLIYDNLADCYKNQDQYEKAKELYKKSYCINNHLNQNDEILYSIRGIASVYILQDSLEIALKYYQKALSILHNSNDSIWISSILCDIARTYETMEEYKLAKKYINSSIANTAIEDDLSVNYFWKGKILYDLHEYDSAAYYLQAASNGSDINMQATIFNILSNINKAKGNYKKSLLYNDSALTLYDSIQQMIYTSEINNISREQSIIRYEQHFYEKFKKNIFIITSITLISIAIIVFLSIHKIKRSKREKNSLIDELGKIKYIHTNNEINKSTMQNNLFDLWIQTLKTCTELFKTTSSYTVITSIENSKLKKNKELSRDDIVSIQKEIDKIYAATFLKLEIMGFHLTHEDQLFCIFSFLKLSISTIKICMNVESTQALTQRKYRIRKQLSRPIFQLIFS